MNEEQLKYYKLTKVTKRDLDEGVWDAEHKGLYSKDGKRLLMYQRPEEHVGKGKQDVFTFMPGVEIICNEVFEHGSFLRGFKLPDTIVAIGDHALAHVIRSGERLVFPKSLKYFGNHIFGHSEGVFEVEFEEGFKEVDFGNVMNFAAATSVYIPSTMESIGNNGFGAVNFAIAIYVAKESKYFCTVDDVLYDYDKTKLFRCPVIKRGKLIVPEGVTTIVKYAFRFCGADIDSSTIGVAKMSVVLPQSLECIETGAFRHSHLCSLYIGPNVHTIKDNAFEDHFIKEITVSSENPYYESYHGMLIDKRTMKLITISGSFTGKDIQHKWFEVKNNVLIDKKRKTALIVIGYSDGSNAYLAPWEEDEVTQVRNSSKNLIIPKGVEVINGRTFEHCHFESLSIPEGVTYIGDNAFQCMGAKSISLPSTLCYLTPSTMFKDQYFRYMEGEFYFYVPKGMVKKFRNMGCSPSFIEKYFKEVDSKDFIHVSEGTKTDSFEQFAFATDEDLKQGIVDKYKVRYSEDCKKLLKYEGFHSRFSTYRIKEGTEIICNNATPSDRYQNVRTLIIPATVKYLGSCPSFDRLLICGNNVGFAPSSISLRKNDTVYIPCGTWVYYHDELEKARRGKAPEPKYSWSEVEDYRLVELSKASVIMYLKQQEHILTDIIRSTNLVSEYTMYSINGDSQKKYVCYRDANKFFFLDTEHVGFHGSYLLKVLSVLGFSYQDVMDILKVDLDVIKVNKKTKSLLYGRTLARRVVYEWMEDFVDEDSGEVVSIQRGEIIYDRGTTLGEDEVQTLYDLKIPSVSVVHDSNSRDMTYLHYFAYYPDSHETYSNYFKNSVLKQFFPGKDVRNISSEEKRLQAYNLTIMIKAILDNGYYEMDTYPLKIKDNELHIMVSEEENLATLISEYYQVLIDKVRNCDRETDVMPIFPITQDYRELRLYLISHNVDKHLIDSIVTPAINMIQIE